MTRPALFVICSSLAVAAPSVGLAQDASKAIEKTLVEKTVVEKASIEKAASEKTAVEKVAVEKASTEKPTIAKIVVEKNSVEKPSVEKVKDLDSVYTQPPSDDLSYTLQGEFIGEVIVPAPVAPVDSSKDNSVGEAKDAALAKPTPESKVLGLQLRVVGGENFEGLSFYGGLPGEKAHRPKPMKLIGRRSGDFLVLSGGPWAIFVDKDGCNLVDKTGKPLGRLTRVERQSPTLGAKPPEHAIVLFDGSGTEQFQKATMTEDGLLEEGADLKPMIQDFDLHLEFMLPYMPKKEGQGRGNSGIYIMSRYECQILDSFAQEAVNNSCGAIYLFKPADVNMCLPPLVWQTYDVRFTAPRWAANKTKIRNAKISSWLNGVKVQDDVDVPSSTGHGKPEEPSLLPTLLQDHDCPVRFRNAWIVDRGLMTSDSFPVKATREPTVENSTPKAEKAESKLTAKADASASKPPTEPAK
ncbi:MAG: DUF1080 domain-containing protein [Planctomycetota bacterium]|nr:DUF1080 domain-containing protein [Planctomycetota bacterium]